jgi:hypothetical protein
MIESRLDLMEGFCGEGEEPLGSIVKKEMSTASRISTPYQGLIN